VASEQPGNEDRDEQSHGPRECMPCRGTGKLVSNLGGTPSTVTCPWCEGAGVRIAGIDAQAHWGQGEPSRSDAE
jgi:DnaJ-class molecular chaperone